MEYQRQSFETLSSNVKIADMLRHAAPNTQCAVESFGLAGSDYGRLKKVLSATASGLQDVPMDVGDVDRGHCKGDCKCSGANSEQREKTKQTTGKTGP